LRGRKQPDPGLAIHVDDYRALKRAAKLFRQKGANPAAGAAAIAKPPGTAGRPAGPGDAGAAGAMDVTIAPQQKRFRIALSFPGEHRPFVEQVATRLAESVGFDKVLYDKFHEAEFARPNLDTHLQRLYHDETDLIAVFLCAEYEQKKWCGLEWRAIRDLINGPQAATVMLLRFDKSEIPGMFPTDGYVWIGDRTPDDIANLILERLRINAEGAVAHGKSTA